MGEEVIERLAACGLQVIVKLHDRSYDRGERGSGRVDWADRLAKYDSHPLVRVAHGGDSSPLLAASDVLISDHSSIAFEFMLLDRPVIVLDRPGLVQQAGINPEKVELLRSAAVVVQSAVALPAAVLTVLRQPEMQSAERRLAASQLFYRPGTATDRAVDLIYMLVELPAAADPLLNHAERRARIESRGVLPAAG
jgi:CDP-glycerol glycerophosphotransferase (TagB/SpsB family)